MTPTNQITLISYEKYEEGESITLYDFSKLDHYYNGKEACYRILCGNRFYYFVKSKTAIISITIK